MKNIVRQNVSLENNDRNTVLLVAHKLGLSFSSALRFVIREWAETNLQRFQITEAGREALAEANSGNQPA